MSDDGLNAGGLRDWLVTCECGAEYTPKGRTEPETCYQCGSAEIQVRELATDGGYESAVCRECGVDVGAGYLCDDCDTVEGWP